VRSPLGSRPKKQDSQHPKHAIAGNAAKQNTDSRKHSILRGQPDPNPVFENDLNFVGLRIHLSLSLSLSLSRIVIIVIVIVITMFYYVFYFINFLFIYFYLILLQRFTGLLS
jgi:hypothetical protein